MIGVLLFVEAGLAVVFGVDIIPTRATVRVTVRVSAFTTFPVRQVVCCLCLLTIGRSTAS